jgi:hypothetical protein
MTNDEIIKLAIENTIHGLKFDEEGLLRFAKLLAQHEPYAFEAFMYSNDRVKIDPVTGNVSIGTPQRTLVGLTDEDVWEKVDMREHAEGNLGIGTAQPQRKWVGLTNDELTDLFYNKNLGQESAVGQAIALLKERNT